MSQAVSPRSVRIPPVPGLLSRGMSLKKVYASMEDEPPNDTGLDIIVYAGTCKGKLLAVTVNSVWDGAVRDVRTMREVSLSTADEIRETSLDPTSERLTCEHSAELMTRVDDGATDKQTSANIGRAVQGLAWSHLCGHEMARRNRELAQEHPRSKDSAHTR